MSPKRALPLKRHRSAARPEGRRSPLFVVAGAAAVGMLLARAIDWRSHAHPR